jgi:leucyl aminopeptidase
MKINFYNTNSHYAEIMVFPLAQDGKQKENIERIAKRFGFSHESVSHDFKGNLKECLPVYLKGKYKKIYIIGLGENPKFADFLSAGRSFVHQQKGKVGNHIGIDFKFVNPKLTATNLEAFLNGMLLGRYNINLHKTETKEHPPFMNGEAELSIFTALSAPKVETAIHSARQIAETQVRIFDLVNSPANKKTPQILAQWAEQSANTYGFKTTAYIGRETLENLGTHALLAVNKGSAEPPAFIVMEYTPSAAIASTYPTIGLVGKGVTFDTGGISIKPSANMHNMKSDMGGAAAVLGTMEAVAKLQLPIRVVGIVPSTENCVDGMSTKPSDVFSSYSGKTIEMIDTDAEGRLILADGLSYMVKNFQPDIMIDLATLTGSVVSTLGYVAAGLFTNNDTLADELYQTGRQCGEKLWRLPIWDNYKDDLNSDVADVRNYSGKPIAGAITAAKFLEVFTEKHGTWAHLDIAGVAFTDGEFSTMKSATGFGIRLLTDFIKSKIK